MRNFIKGGLLFLALIGPAYGQAPGPGPIPSGTLIGTSGGIPYFNSGGTAASSALLSANALMVGGGAGTAPSTVTTGANVLTALRNAVGASGGLVVIGGAGGTPSSLTLTNASGLPISGIASLGSGVGTAMGTATNGASGLSVLNSSAGLSLTPSANNYGVNITGGSVTGSGTNGVGLNITGTMNTTGVVDGAAIFANITNTASGAGSTLLDFQIGNVSQFKIDAAGNSTFSSAQNAGTYVYINNTSLGGHTWQMASGGFSSGGGNNVGLFYLGDTTLNKRPLAISGAGIISTTSVGTYSWGSDSSFAGTGPDTLLYRDGTAGSVALQNGTNAQSFRVYNTWSSSGANYERCFGGDWKNTSNVCSYGTTYAGIGSARAVQFLYGGTLELDINETTSGVITAALPITITSAAATAGAGAISYGGTTAASTSCGTLTLAAGCIVVNVAGTTHYIPYF